MFTKLARAISVAAREGGGDPEMNPALRAAIDKAKAANVPKHNIERAVKRGTGELAGDIIEAVTYEGYGPGGAAILVEALTDNRNRTAGEVRHSFTKHGGSLGQDGSVSWMFDRKGVIRVAAEAFGDRKRDEIELEMIESGAEDLQWEEEGPLIVVPFGELAAATERVREAGYEIASSEPEYLPKDRVPYDEASHRGLETLLSALDENEDVQSVSTNIERP